jgi:uncharacterized protein (DUF2141 family)
MRTKATDTKMSAQMPKSQASDNFCSVNVTFTNRRCKMKKIYSPLIVAVLTFFVSIAYAQTGTIHVEIPGINDVKGLMSIGLYSDKKGFPDKGKEYRGKEVKVTAKTVVYTFKDVPLGTYAIAIFHDTNSNTKLDKNFLGIPKEGYAFSNNVFGALGLPPSFEDASFEVAGKKTVKIKMEY